MTTDWPLRLELDTGAIRALDLALYAAASGDHNALHLDETVAGAAGFDAAVVHGMLTMAHAGRLFTRSFGPGSVRALHTRFTGVALRGDRLRLEAELDGVEAGMARYRLRATCAGREIATGWARVQP